MMRLARHVERTAKKRNTNTIVVGIPDVRTSLGRPRLKWRNIKMDLKETR
jgi:hypothetical protein